MTARARKSLARLVSAYSLPAARSQSVISSKRTSDGKLFC